ncbi:hypothetical protein KIPB_002790 [Kipferlia bialata]|uniref:PDEase domain-containing protein n=1 Tax=Kipferlia bialata TaxID=797122 RepID=A0A9K3GGY4_9EUKA|nr:hypothetical protein KIPB_002790 [Kipferlia bialata]|eukprot:g2790.t1
MLKDIFNAVVGEIHSPGVSCEVCNSLLPYVPVGNDEWSLSKQEEYMVTLCLHALYSGIEIEGVEGVEAEVYPVSLLTLAYTSLLKRLYPQSPVLGQILLDSISSMTVTALSGTMPYLLQSDAFGFSGPVFVTGADDILALLQMMTADPVYLHLVTHLRLLAGSVASGCIYTHRNGHDATTGGRSYSEFHGIQARVSAEMQAVGEPSHSALKPVYPTVSRVTKLDYQDRAPYILADWHAPSQSPSDKDGTVHGHGEMGSVTMVPEVDTHRQPAKCRHTYLADNCRPLVRSWAYNVVDGKAQNTRTWLYRKWCDLCGIVGDDAETEELYAFPAHIRPMDIPRVTKCMADCHEIGTPFFVCYAQRVPKDIYYWIRDTGSVVRYGKDGKPELIAGYVERLPANIKATDPLESILSAISRNPTHGSSPCKFNGKRSKLKPQSIPFSPWMQRRKPALYFLPKEGGPVDNYPPTLPERMFSPSNHINTCHYCVDSILRKSHDLHENWSAHTLLDESLNNTAFDAHGFHEQMGPFSFGWLFLYAHVQLVGSCPIHMHIGVRALARVLFSMFRLHRSVPFHNSVHTLDMLQMTLTLSHAIRRSFVGKVLLSPLMQLLVMFAACAKNLDNPGLSTDYLVGTNNPVTIIHGRWKPKERQVSAVQLEL